MIHLKKLFIALVVLFFCVAFRPLHHGWANYDLTKTFDFVTTIEESTYENPHTTIKAKYNDITWLVVLAPVSRMEARGVTADMIKKGTKVQVVAYPHKKIKDEMRAERIFIDGTKYELR